MSVVESFQTFDESSDLRWPAPPQAVVRSLRIGLLGYGRVGQAVAGLAENSRAALRADGLDIDFKAALVRDVEKTRSGPRLPLYASPEELFARPFELLIDVMGGEHPAFELVRRALQSGIHVVTANKTLVATHGLELEAVARRFGVAFAYDAAVLAGVPFLGALARRPIIASPQRVTGIVNGTSHFIAGELAAGGSFAAALAEAVARGYAEPDSSADISGRDAAEKLTILLHLLGCRRVTVGDLTTRGIDTITPADILGARALGGVIKPVAVASLDPDKPGAWVGPAFVDRAHDFSALSGVQNAIEFAGSIGDPVTFAGPGAGPRITAATILDDVVEAVTGVGQSLASTRRQSPVGATALRQPAAGRWFLRAAGERVTTAHVADALGSGGVAYPHVLECARGIVARTAQVSWPAIDQVVTRLRGAGHEAIAFPIVERS